MKLPLLVAFSLLALAWTIPAADAIPPVCLEKSATAARTTVHVMLTCGPSVTITHCPPHAHGPCWTMTTELLP